MNCNRGRNKTSHCGFMADLHLAGDGLDGLELARKIRSGRRSLPYTNEG